MNNHKNCAKTRTLYRIAGALGFILLLVLAGAEYGQANVNTASAYAATPYDRCVEAHDGTPAANQCHYLK